MVKRSSHRASLGARLNFNPYNSHHRRTSVDSSTSRLSHGSPAMHTITDDEAKDPGRCTVPDCGKKFKDLKAHMLTHLAERPEKCPIPSCEYHTKGFARKYDCARHTLTHFKGTMICGFCPGSGTSSEKTFNRADVFKRHLATVHNVEQTSPNNRRKSPAPGAKKSTSASKKLSGKCSTCSQMFKNAQDFYDHLDECVLKMLARPARSESINATNLGEMMDDPQVKETLVKNSASDAVMQNIQDEDRECDEDEEEVEEEGPNGTVIRRTGPKGRGMTRSKMSYPLQAKGRRKRKDYPVSWGCSKEQMKMKKRVLCVFDGPRRLWKDEMMLSNEHEAREPIGNDIFVTDLDKYTLERAAAIHETDEESRGPDIPANDHGILYTAHDAAVVMQENNANHEIGVLHL